MKTQSCSNICSVNRGHGFLACCFLVFFIALVGCTQRTIPYRVTLRVDPLPSEQKLKPQLTVRMQKELSKLVVTVRSLNFPVGESLIANFLTTLNPLFGAVQFSTLQLEQTKGKGCVLDVNLKSYDFRFARTILPTFSVKLVIEYGLYDENGNATTTFTTDTSCTSKLMTGGVVLGGIFQPALGDVSYRNSIGRAYDEALAKSIDVLITNMKKAWTR